MLQVSKLTKAYGGRTLFEDVTFSLISGEKLGLVGRNGCGKSTLFKLILNEEHPDEGQISFPRGYTVGHLAQHLVFTEESVLAEACLGLPEHDRDQTYKGEIILNGLGFSDEDMVLPPSEFSGGFQIRINLAKLLLSEPNLLLLDEPTNYLDIVSMRWLTDFLNDWRGELIVISHDRMFMDNITTHSMLIHRGAVRKVKGPTAKLYEQVALDEEIFEKTRVNEEKKRKDLEEFINRFRAQASKAALVQSRMKALERMGTKEQLADQATLDFRFQGAPFPGKQMAEVNDLEFSYDEGMDLMRGLSLTIQKGDRIGVIGKNGRGKSTFLRLLAGELSPTGGSTSLNINSKLGYFGQTNISRLDPKLTVEDTIYEVNSRMPRAQVRGICGAMMFSGDDALKKVGVLSGGEKSRVLLGKILAAPSNILLLDEPTNHLDMESIEALVESLNDYEGAVVIVTHSELILRKLATRLLVFHGGTPHMFEHDYEYFLEKEGWSDESEMSASMRSTVKETPKAEEKAPPKPANNQQQQEKLAAKNQKKISAIEEAVYKLESERSAAEEALARAYEQRNNDEAVQHAARLEKLRLEIEQEFSKLEKLTSAESA